jgi:hypothetical protein
MMYWHHWRRFFHLQGKVGGLRYEARFGIFEMSVPATITPGNDLEAAKKLLPLWSANERTAPPEHQVWESEGGASDRSSD